MQGTPALSLIGPGSISGSTYLSPPLSSPQTATIVAATANAYAVRQLRLLPPPPPAQHVIAVASYYGGIALHDPRTFALLGIVPTPGAPGDVAIGPGGDIFAPMTDANTMVAVKRLPWGVSAVAGVPFGNEVIVARDGSAYVSNRDINGKGAVTRLRAGAVQRVETGVTAEGLVLDERAKRLYVGNVNDGTILELDAVTLAPVRRITAVPRVFGIALDTAHSRIFAVSNQNTLMRRGGGYVAAIDLISGRTAARSRDILFPLGAAFDARTNRLFVTDEDTGNVYVLDGRTLAARHSPVHACAVPWRPHLDAASRLLYVPCTRAGAIFVMNVDTMREASGSPFVTGRYPLGVATP